MRRNLVDCFYLLDIFDVDVPVDYNHDEQLKEFFRSSAGKAARFKQDQDKLIDKNFSNVTHHLVPGKSYLIKMFIIREDVTSEECLILLKSQKAVLVGVQGLVFLWKNYSNKLPDDKNTVSLDTEQALWRDKYNRCRVPYLSKEVDGGWMLYLGKFESGLSRIDCLVCFCEK